MAQNCRTHRGIGVTDVPPYKNILNLSKETPWKCRRGKDTLLYVFGIREIITLCVFLLFAACTAFIVLVGPWYKQVKKN
jgi:hypothetical protein